jgi:putative membrane protein
MAYSVKADTFFTEEEKKRIENTTGDIEKRTIGEVVVMVVDRSDEYREAEVIGGVFLGSLFALIASVLLLHSSLWSYIPLSFLFFFPSVYLFKKFPVLKISFIGHGRKELAVMQRAVRAFYEKGLYKTRQNTGVLFFLSLLEHKVWILADKGICEKIDQDTLNRFAQTVSHGIKEGRACDALCDAMKEAGELLARHFPITAGDTDELSDKVMTGE